jgi:hypothetical protein
MPGIADVGTFDLPRGSPPAGRLLVRSVAWVGQWKPDRGPGNCRGATPHNRSGRHAAIGHTRCGRCSSPGNVPPLRPLLRAPHLTGGQLVLHRVTMDSAAAPAVTGPRAALNRMTAMPPAHGAWCADPASRSLRRGRPNKAADPESSDMWAPHAHPPDPLMVVRGSPAPCAARRQSRCRQRRSR